MRSALLLLTALLIVLAATVVSADTTITQVTANSIEDSLPQVKGNLVVWQGYDGNDWEVFLYNVATGTTIQITDNDEDDVSPQTDGRYVVWLGFNDGEWDVFFWDGTEVRSISDVSAEDMAPQIADGVIVWTSKPLDGGFLGPGEIVLYEAASGTKLELSAQVDPGNTLDDRLPIINDGAVVWIQTDDTGGTTGYMYRLGDGTIIINPDDVRTNSRSSDGNLRVLSRHDRLDAEIFLYSSYSKKYYQITHNSSQDRYPSISGNLVTWMADGEIFLAECEYLTLLRPIDGVTLSPASSPTFAWEAIGYDNSKVEFSKFPDFATGSVLTLPPGEQGWLAGTSFGPTEENWKSIVDMVEGEGTVYWRVIAADNDGNRAFSETRHFVIERTGGSPLGTAIVDIGTDPLVEGGGSNCFITAAADGQPGGSSGWTFPLSLILSLTSVLTPLVLSAWRKLHQHS
ncbi:MAG: hypothetical protein JRI70_00095 [Deltaproteobacteria bacterium]|nr:hypothetical protein [Deltaproteobacteria bacterium]MBW2171803.1 hypothetical protein [Deltaproteobacteria bacterium]